MGAGEIWAETLSQAGKNIGSGISDALKEYKQRQDALEQSDLAINYFHQAINPATNKPFIADKDWEAYKHHSDKQRATLGGVMIGGMKMAAIMQKAIGQTAQPVVDERGNQIGYQRKGATYFFPQDIRHPEYAQQRELSSVQKPLLSEIKDIEGHFQKNYNISPDTFTSGGGISTTPGQASAPASPLKQYTFGMFGSPGQPATPAELNVGTDKQGNPKTVDAGTFKDLTVKAQRYSDLRQAVTAPDPLKTLKAIDWVRKNPNDPRAPKWLQWIKSQVGTQGVVTPPPVQPDQQQQEPADVTPPEDATADTGE